MPTEVIDMLAGLTVERAVFLALMLFGTPAAVVLYVANSDLDLRTPVVRAAGSVHQAAVHAGHDVNRWLALALAHAAQLRDRARLILIAGLLLAVAYLDTTSNNGGSR